MASTSRSENRWSHEVFLSFRCSDTRNTFTDHLYHALKSRGINVFIDNELERGEFITSQLSKVIEESRISIVILSEKYASSSFCLDELANILECRVSKEHKVIPVFYHVDPTDVEEQKGTFGQEFAKLEAQFSSARSGSLLRTYPPKKRLWIYNEEVASNMKMVQEWRSALTEVAKLSGWHLESWNHEATSIQSIVKMVMKEIEGIPSHDIEHGVGLTSRVDYILEKLSLESNEVRVLGLYGMGGIGKTTLANALYVRCVKQFEFEGSCFLLNVRENSKKYGHAKIQEDILYQILGDQKELTGNFMKGMKLIKQSVGSKKVFVVIDDVDHVDQLEKLVGKLEWFGAGSRIIITTRDLHLLKYHGGTTVHEVIGLKDDEAMRLLSWHAFKKDHPSEVYMDLSSRVVEYAGGHRLTLKVLGSHLNGRSVLGWQDELKKLKQCPKDDIINVLKISYDGLDSEEKVIFLDIALLLRGRRIDVVTHFLDSCGFGAYIGIQRLVEKSLVYVNKIQRLEMHDLLEEMATQIALKETSRLCIRKREEIPSLFYRDKNPQSVEGILIDFDGKEEEPLNLLQFTKLRILVIRKGCFTTMPSLPNNVRYLEWEDCSFQSIPSEFLPAELAILRMPRSSIVRLEKPLDDNEKAKKFMNLTLIDFSYCTYLREMVDFSAIPNLEEMNLTLCTNLKKIDATIGNLKRLRKLILRRCYSLSSLPSLEENHRLELINVEGCSELKNLPNLPTTITQLILCYSAIKKIPLYIENLIYLKASFCKMLIDTFILVNCPNLPNLPKAEGSMLSSNRTSTIVFSIDLSLNNFISLPINTFKFTQIVELFLNRCEWLVEIPPLPHTIRLLSASYCKSLVRFSQFQFEDFEGDFSNCQKMIENEKQSWREIVEKVSMKKKKDFSSRKYSVQLPENEIPEWFSYSCDKPTFQVPVPAFNSNIIGIAFCAIFPSRTRIQFSVDELTVTCTCSYTQLESEHMWLGFMTGFDRPKLLEADEIWCRFLSEWDTVELECILFTKMNDDEVLMCEFQNAYKESVWR